MTGEEFAAAHPDFVWWFGITLLVAVTAGLYLLNKHVKHEPVDCGEQLKNNHGVAGMLILGGFVLAIFGIIVWAFIGPNVASAAASMSEQVLLIVHTILPGS